jgi:phosphoglycerate dehydrogenase-like enzyme
MIDEPQLKMMKKTAILLNAARGPVINEKALVRALKEGWIGGAGLDVVRYWYPAANRLNCSAR